MYVTTAIEYRQHEHVAQLVVDLKSDCHGSTPTYSAKQYALNDQLRSSMRNGAERLAIIHNLADESFSERGVSLL